MDNLNETKRLISSASTPSHISFSNFYLTRATRSSTSTARSSKWSSLSCISPRLQYKRLESEDFPYIDADEPEPSRVNYDGGIFPDGGPPILQTPSQVMDKEERIKLEAHIQMCKKKDEANERCADADFPPTYRKCKIHNCTKRKQALRHIENCYSESCPNRFCQELRSVLSHGESHTSRKSCPFCNSALAEIHQEKKQYLADIPPPLGGDKSMFMGYQGDPFASSRIAAGLREHLQKKMVEAMETVPARYHALVFGKPLVDLAMEEENDAYHTKYCRASYFAMIALKIHGYQGAARGLNNSRQMWNIGLPEKTRLNFVIQIFDSLVNLLDEAMDTEEKIVEVLSQAMTNEKYQFLYSETEKEYYSGIDRIIGALKEGIRKVQLEKVQVVTAQPNDPSDVYPLSLDLS